MQNKALPLKKRPNEKYKHNKTKNKKIKQLLYRKIKTNYVEDGLLRLKLNCRLVGSNLQFLEFDDIERLTSEIWCLIDPDVLTRRISAFFFRIDDIYLDNLGIVK